MKTYRVYFNRTAEWPQVWSVDEGKQTSEINVQGFAVFGCSVVSRTLTPEQSAGLNPKDTPFAWFEVQGTLSIEDGVAVIRG